MADFYSQISDKYVERRLLVSETCGTLAPYLSVSNLIIKKIRASSASHLVNLPFACTWIVLKITRAR